MAGGYKPGAGRPKAALDSYPRTRRSAASKLYVPPPEVLALFGLVPGERMTPLQFLLVVMNDPAVHCLRRDAAARAAVPFCRAKAGQRATIRSPQAERRKPSTERDGHSRGSRPARCIADGAGQIGENDRRSHYSTAFIKKSWVTIPPSHGGNAGSNPAGDAT